MCLIVPDYARIVPTYKSLNSTTDHAANTVIGRITEVPACHWLTEMTSRRTRLNGGRDAQFVSVKFPAARRTRFRGANERQTLIFGSSLHFLLRSQCLFHLKVRSRLENVRQTAS